MVSAPGMEENKVGKRTKEFRRSRKVRKAMDLSYLRDLSSFKSISNFSKIENKLESRKATDEDFQADQLFYEEMGINADEFVEESVFESYEKEHRKSFRNVEDEFTSGNDQVARLPIKVNNQVIAQPSNDDDVEMEEQKEDAVSGKENQNEDIDDNDDVGSFLSFDESDVEGDEEDSEERTEKKDG